MRARDYSQSTVDLDAVSRRVLWKEVSGAIEKYGVDVRSLAIAPPSEPGVIRSILAGLNPNAPIAPAEAIRLVVGCMRDHQLHAAHPGYFGLFVPAPSTMGVLAEALAAGFNPQLASWGHAPFAVEAEQWVVRVVSQRLGFSDGSVEGTVTTGGSEANLTSLLVALQSSHPRVVTEGLSNLVSWPCLYVSAEAHHSWRKAARIAGLGDRAIRIVPCDRVSRMSVTALRRMLAEDRGRGLSPFMVVATVGTTACGAIDPLEELRGVANSEELWLHADAAWGGAAAFSETHRHVVAGISAADSVSLDAHKWMSVPMGAGLYISRHPGTLRSVFGVDAPYLPASSASEPVAEPYQESIQWSRRFSGLKILLLLATAGWAGIAEVVDSCFVLGALLKAELKQRGWVVVNETPLPIVCFQDDDARESPGHHAAIVARVNRRGKSWVSSIPTAGGDMIRACVCNYRTTSRDVDVLIAELQAATGRNLV